MNAYALLAVALMVYGTYIATIWFAFRRDERHRPTSGYSILRLATIGSVAWILTEMVYRGRVSFQAGTWSLALFAVSYSLFWWTYFTNRNKRLTLAFSTDLPKHLVSEGPYRWVRHPYYLGYLLGYLAGAVGAQSWPLLTCTAVMGAVYFAAARKEETKFLRSKLAKDYKTYQSEVGMFMPVPRFEKKRVLRAKKSQRSARKSAQK